MPRKKKVAYFYDPDVGSTHFGPGHPMKPHRLSMTNALVMHYGLYKQMEMLVPYRASTKDMAAFHDEEYLHFLQTVTPDNQRTMLEDVREFALAKSDCPVFHGMYTLAQISAGGSIGGAAWLNSNAADVAINWAGGLHHAKKSEASGFCYVNDIVLGILEFLKYHQRVLYLDLDVHHGDGVEEAFLTTSRVLTVSIHKFGNKFFPGTGGLLNVGNGPGMYYSINVPLTDGITDETYEQIFRPLMTAIMERYQPGALVVQCGADSISGDRLGVFNLTVRGHARCVRFMADYGLPTLVVGGGGYTMCNVARCWAYETGVLLGHDLDEDLPPHEYLQYYAPDFRLHVPPHEDQKNENEPEALQKLLQTLLEHVSNIEPVAPAGGFGERPPDAPVPKRVKLETGGGDAGAEKEGGREEEED